MITPPCSRYDVAGGDLGDASSSKKMAFQKSNQWQNALVSPAPSSASMSNLPKSLAAIQAAVTSILWPSHHSGSLYDDAANVANTLNIAADVENSTPGATKVDWTLLLRAFLSHDMEGYCFQSKIIKLENHVSNNIMDEINTRCCKEYLTAVADPKEILEVPLIKNNNELL